MIQYPDAKIAEQSGNAFRERFLHDSSGNYTRVEDETWLGSKLADNMLICVFNAKTLDEARNLVDKVNINQ
jgi:hypothetical protein